MYLCVHSMPSHLLQLYSYFVHLLYIVLIYCLIKFRLQYKGTPKYLGESVTGVELRFQNLWDSLCVAVKDDRSRMLIDAQTCQHNSTVHVQRFSHLKGRADDCDVIGWHHCCYAYIKVGGLYKGAHMSLRALIWVFGCNTFCVTCEESQTLYCGYLSASWGVRLQPYREVFFIYSTVSAQGYLGYPVLVCFSCLQVNWVAHHPTSLRPCIGAARTTIFWSKLVHMG